MSVLNKVQLCQSCKRIEVAGQWRSISSYILGYLEARGDQYHLTICPHCEAMFRARSEALEHMNEMCDLEDVVIAFN